MMNDKSEIVTRVCIVERDKNQTLINILVMKVFSVHDNKIVFKITCVSLLLNIVKDNHYKAEVIKNKLQSIRKAKLENDQFLSSLIRTRI